MDKKDLKIKIKRGFTRKVNLGNYESFDTWADRSIELPSDTPEKDQKDWSQYLFDECKSEVMSIVNQYNKKDEYEAKNNEPQKPEPRQYTSKKLRTKVGDEIKIIQE